MPRHHRKIRDSSGDHQRQSVGAPPIPRLDGDVVEAAILERGRHVFQSVGALSAISQEANMRGLWSTSRIALCAALAAGGLLASQQAASAAVSASGDPALYWNQVLAGGISGTPVAQSRTYAMVSTAIHDAVNATSGFQDASYIQGAQTFGGDTRVATAVAAASLLTTLNEARSSDYATALSSVLNSVPDGAAKTNGIATGQAIAAATLAQRAHDGFNAVVNYAPTGELAHWAPTPPGFGAAVAPQWGDVAPWILSSGDKFRPAPPPNFGSLEYAAAYAEVMAIGAANSGVRSLDQTTAAQFWAGTAGAQQWVQAGVSIAETAGLSTIENARMFALLTTSIADTFIGVWDSKFEFDFWRPYTAIHTLDDGNPLTTADLTWTPLINTPSYPGYAGGLSGFNGAGSTILTSFLGDAHSFCMAGSAGSRCWNSFSEAALDGANSRLWGGIHFRFDNEQGLALGQNVARYALASSVFDAVPEPATWLMMILGFGLAGWQLRRRQAAALLLR
jgi:hypothetical protein